MIEAQSTIPAYRTPEFEVAELTIASVVRVSRWLPAFAPFTCRTYAVMSTMLSSSEPSLLKRILPLGEPQVGLQSSIPSAGELAASSGGTAAEALDGR